MAAQESLRQPLLAAEVSAAEHSEAGAQPPPPPLALPPDPEAPGQHPSDAKRDQRREVVGLAFNALATVFGTGMSLFAKISGSQGIGVFEIVLTRSLLLVLFTGPPLLRARVNPFQDERRRWLLVLRGLLGFCSISSLYLAVALLPLADASVLSFLSPLFVAALGPVILKERSSLGVLLGIPVALLGVVLVAQPPFLFGGEQGGISGLGVVVGVSQACFNALARMCVRALSLGSSEPMASIIFGQGAISVAGAAIMCAATKNFTLPTQPAVWAPLLAGGLLGYFYQLALTAGLQRARAAPAVAMSYLSVIWGVAADMLVFHDMPDRLGLVGAGIICASSFFVAFSQKRRGSRKHAESRWAQSSARLRQEAGEEAPADGAAPAAGGGAGGPADALLRAAQPGEGGWDAAAGEPPLPPLKSDVKQAAAIAAAAAGGDAELAPPDTPAASPVAPPAVGAHAGSADSLLLQGGSPGASSSQSWPHLAGGSPPPP